MLIKKTENIFFYSRQWNRNVKNLLNNIFDLNKPTSRPGTSGENGTGYGMPLVKNLWKSSGGTIEIKSKEKPDPSAGTEVILTLRKAEKYKK